MLASTTVYSIIYTIFSQSVKSSLCYTIRSLFHSMLEKNKFNFGSAVTYFKNFFLFALKITMEFFKAPAHSGNIFSKIKAYHAKHPIIVAHIILGAMSLSYSAWGFSQHDYNMLCISKYKRDYIVVRPDDPSVKMIKRGRIGMDY